LFEGEIVDATVVSVLPQQVLFKIEGKAEATMLNYMRNNRQKLSPGQVIEVYVEDVRENGAGPQIIVSNGSIEIVKRYLEREIPEIEEGIIEVIVVSRIPGFKSKIAIKSNNPNIDPSGSVIGPRGSRINAVSDHLFGERIDVIR
jgi:N utilization substance protein A